CDEASARQLKQSGEFRARVPVQGNDSGRTLRVNPSDQIDSLEFIPVDGGWYEFDAYSGCDLLFDLNSDGSLNAADVAEWYSSPVNLNHIPEVDGYDLLTLIRGINEHGD